MGAIKYNGKEAIICISFKRKILQCQVKNEMPKGLR
jgi:hypothetical protein